MIDDSYCYRVGTERQHRYACVLASQLGYSRLRDAVAAALGRSVSRCLRVITLREASEVIEWLQARIAEESDESTTTTTRLHGREAVEYAAQHGCLLCTHADPTEDARDDVTPEEAAEICREDPSLVYIDVPR